MDRTDTHPGLGPTRSRKLIEFFGGVEGVLNASLTSLEAAGLPVEAAQSLEPANRSNLLETKLPRQMPQACSLSRWMTRYILRGCDKSTILRSCCTFVATWML
jgi:hypothetical protein